LTRPEEEVKYEEEMVEDTVTFLYALKGLQLARKYMWQIGIENSIVSICYKLENELYRKKPTLVCCLNKHNADHLTSCYYHITSVGYYLHFVSSNVLIFAVFSLKCMRMSDVGYQLLV